MDEIDEIELNTIIVTNIPEIMFNDQIIKKEFEDLFLNIDAQVIFLYLKSFLRCRVTFSSGTNASIARIQLHKFSFHDQIINCYFAQPDMNNKSPYLEPPPLEKQFLISPPASPPVGWEQDKEKEPTINYDLLTAITNMAPGEAHELYADSEDLPKIVVHICEDPEGFKKRPMILQTRCPQPIN